MTRKDVVWLGTPVTSAGKDLCSVYTSRIGGTATLFREATDNTVFRCPKCCGMHAVSLLAQVYAPLEVYDRVLYVLTCSSCSTAQNSFCFVLRSQNFNPAYANALKPPEQQGCKEDGALFEVNADWGDGVDEGWGTEDEADAGAGSSTSKNQNSTAGMAAEAITEDTHSTEEPAALAPPGSRPSIKGVGFPCFVLDVFEEPPKLAAKSSTFKNELQETQKKYGDNVVEMTIIEDDDEPLPEKCLRKYVERIGRAPSQCVRWAPGQEPLRSSVVTVAAPRCPYCNKERRYELQLTSPIIYFLTNTKGPRRHSLHFGNVLVFTCSGNCNTEAYASEYCVVEDEI
ncbi:pre-rRNA-processing protein TSR4 [Trypanosoma rangeli]|uniref:Pre-rRNA-processing protein TSR4 n=1 Tax=Trypanosoma rangeli TaxID=5698 RepID=A0A3R7N1R1_TRYRA|nr:pre-rRNA-processing protein TSR4 [Trypanosoma rangeli]RNE98604.1 pre-rRNA-processing protein TSR4 [Trypanosoma rangeli]|eukprot:RNE98604.1 pre-rRNA-processing protein TSR4 [Trypanosoma rangeli]